MEAILSGIAGVGLLLDGESAWMIRHEQPDDPVATTPALGRRLLMGREGGLRHFIVSSIADGYRLLKGQYERALACNLTFLLLDDSVSVKLRQKTAILLEEVLQEREVFDYAQGILYSLPLPSLSPCESALSIALGVGVSRTSRLLQEVAQDQDAIRLARHSWDSVQYLIPTADHPFALQEMVEGGLFYGYVRALHTKQAGSFQFKALEALKEFANHRDVVHFWCQPLPHPAHARPLPLVAEKKERKEKTWSGRKKVSVDRGKAFGNVIQIKDQIVALFNQRPLDETRLDRLLDRLRHLHATKGDRKLLSKSLTDLAVRAKEAGIGSYHLLLAREAVEANEGDGTAWAVLAAALRSQGQLKEAFDAAVQSIGFGNRLYGYCEKAETLKAMNRMEDALRAYDEVVEAFPENVVARNGRADTLKAMNRLEDALRAYDEVVEEFPENVVARTGRADTLKTMNRLEDALRAYDEVVEAFPENVVARNGRADTLKAMNRLEDALRAYREVSRLFPGNVVARTGQAGVLLAMGLVDEAVEILAVAEHPMTKDDWIGYHIRAGIHLHRGELREAEKMFCWGVENAFPSDRDYFKRGLAATHLRMCQFDQVEQELSTLNAPQWEPSVLLMRAHMNGLQGNRQRVAELLHQFNNIGKVYCNGYYMELDRHFRQGLPMNDDALFEQGACCLAMAA